MYCTIIRKSSNIARTSPSLTILSIYLYYMTVKNVLPIHCTVYMDTLTMNGAVYNMGRQWMMRFKSMPNCFLNGDRITVRWVCDYSIYNLGFSKIVDVFS